MADTSKEMKEMVETLLKSASAKAKAGANEEARDLLEQAVELDAGSTRAWDLLGFVRWALSDIAGAEECNRKSLAIKPLNAYAHKGLGVCLADQGRVDEGVAELHHAMALKPLWTDPVHDLAVVLFRAGRYEESLRWLRQLVEMDPKLEAKVLPLIRQAEAKVEAAGEV